MMYELHQLGWHSFQQLCLTIAGEVLGQTVQSFSDSNDAGRDGAFSGTWKPSSGEDFHGQFVVQCKFKGDPKARFGAAQLTDEVEKARRLVALGRCDIYLLLTNAYMSGVAAETIENLFRDVGVPSVKCFGGEWICQQIRERKRLRMLVPRVYGIGDLSQILDERAYDQAKALLASMREDLSKVVLTGVYEKAAKALDEHRFVLLIGEPAAGKTTVAALLAMAAIDQWNASTLKLETPAAVAQHWNIHEQSQFFWVDDAFGVTQYDHAVVSDWNRVFPKVKAMLAGGSRVVLTSRDYIYKRARKDLKLGVLPSILESQVVIDVRDLTIMERRQILYNHVKLGNQPLEFRKAIKPFLEGIASHRRFAPETARRLGTAFFTKKLRLTQNDLFDFVTKQESFLQDVIQGLDADNHAALGMIFMRSGALESPIELRAPEVSALERLGSSLAGCTTALSALDESLVLQVIEDGRRLWKFRHPTIGDAFAALLLMQPELLGIYVISARADQLVQQITCGDVGLENAVIVPRSLFPLVVERLGELSPNPEPKDATASSLCLKLCPKHFRPEMFRLTIKHGDGKEAGPGAAGQAVLRD